VLLTSRRGERAWLGDLPARITLPSMPMAERVRLARALAAKQGHRLGEVEDWRPLLAYSQGNPLTVTVLVGQALRDGLRTRAQVEEFVARLRAGEQDPADDERQGRSRSLGASLGYGFTHAFSEAERAQLALLHLFEGFINVDALTILGDPGQPGGPVAAVVVDLTREQGIGLLDRAAEVGLLTAYGEGFYGIHPALPWYFAELFTTTIGPVGSPAAEQATRAYTTTIAYLGDYYHGQYEQGRRGAVGTLGAEEANLLQARRLARTHGWWNQVIAAMQGLRRLYEHTGRNLEWARLVEELVPDLVDPATDGPRPGREEQWGLVNDYRVRLALQQRDYATAERLQRTRLAWDRERAATALASPSAELDDDQRALLRTLAVGVHELGEILREQQQPACVEAYTEVLELARRIGDRLHEAIAAYNLGHAYKDLPELRDLDKAARWYQDSLDRNDEADHLGRARCVAELVYVHWERFREARAAGRPEAELLTLLKAAADAYQQALELLPADAVGDLAVAHNQLGNICSDGGQLGVAQRHWQETIRYDEAAGNRYGAAQTRYNVAVALANRGRFGDGLLWAQAALRDFQTYGDRAAAEIAQTQQLIAEIEEALGGGRG
jgi:tetratricopeptide (TPR) repeat protein